MMANEELRFGGNAGVNRGKGMIKGDERARNGRITISKKEAHGIKTKSKPSWREALQGRKNRLNRTFQGHELIIRSVGT